MTSSTSSSVSKWSWSNQNDSFRLIAVRHSARRSMFAADGLVIVPPVSSLRMRLWVVGRRMPTIPQIVPRRLRHLRLLVLFRKILVSLFLLYFAITYGADVVSASYHSITNIPQTLFATRDSTNFCFSFLFHKLDLRYFWDAVLYSQFNCFCIIGSKCFFFCIMITQ